MFPINAFMPNKFFMYYALIDYDWLVTNIVTNVLMYKHTNGRTKLSKKVFNNNKKWNLPKTYLKFTENLRDFN
jgi:hypothetical protein